MLLLLPQFSRAIFVYRQLTSPTLGCRGWQSIPLVEPTALSFFSFKSELRVVVAAQGSALPLAVAITAQSCATSPLPASSPRPLAGGFMNDVWVWFAEQNTMDRILYDSSSFLHYVFVTV